ncbi:MAG: cell surface protein, partial [Novipirellula sp. JB048]
VMPGDHDVVHLHRIVPPNSTDVDLFKFELKESGKWSAETVAERLTNPSHLNTVLKLYRQNDVDPNQYDLLAQNDRYYGNDSYLELDLEPGTYFVGVTSTGNDNYDPKVPDSGYGGTTDGDYDLKLSFEADRGESGLRDSDGTPLDGNGNGEPGGVHSFWFQASDQASTIYVDRMNDHDLTVPEGDGSISNPFDTIQAALEAAKNRIVVPQDAGSRIKPGDSFTIDDGFNPELTLTFGVGGGKIEFAGLSPTAIAVNIAAAINARVGSSLDAAVDASVQGRVVQLANLDSLDVERTPSLLKAPNLIRIVGNGGVDGDLDTHGDNVPYLIGSDGGVTLRDGLDLLVPQGATLMIDAGTLIKMHGANIDIGSSSVNVSRAASAIQVLGTPQHPVFLRSYHDDTFGGDSDGFGTAMPGDFGGIVIRADSDLERDGVFLNTINHADIQHGGGKVFVDTSEASFDPIHILDARPTLSFNVIADSKGAAISASPNSFEDSLGRIGPDVHGNFLSGNNIDGLLIRVDLKHGSQLERLTVPGRFDDSDITHVLTQNLIIAGNPGGMETDSSGRTLARSAGRLRIDPGVVVKMNQARIEAERGGSTLIAEGTENRPVVFTSLFDDRYGGSGTFNTDSGAFTTGQPGDWAGLFFSEVASGSIDHALISFAGGDSPIEGGSANFAAIEVHQAQLRLANSVLRDNASGNASGVRHGRGANQAATIYVRGAQPVIVGNSIVDNAATAININANALRFENRVDPGRATGPVDRFSQFDDNAGPLVRLNQLANNPINGMTVRGELLTTESIWDDTDIVHVLQSEVTVDNLHTYGGLTLQSSNTESLVVKLFGGSAGFTATGTPLETIDRIGGTIHVLGTPGHPVVLTSLRDDSIGAGFSPDGTVMTNTNNSANVSSGAAGDWRGFKFDQWSNDRNVAITRERENPLTGGKDSNGHRNHAQFLGTMAPNEKSADENRRLGFQVDGFISPDDPTDVDVYSFKATAGTGVWIDIDRSDTALDAIVEVINANGTVLARSNRSGQLTAA